MVPRSLLYVPASRPGMLAKLSALPADAVAIDLEDGVAPTDKVPARDHLRRAAGTHHDGPPWMVRINAEGTPWHAADLELAAELSAPRVVLPKAESPTAVARLAERCSAWDGRIALMIETAPGVGRVRELAGAHRRVDMLILGSADLRLSLGARPDDERLWERHALSELLLAARMQGCAAIDSVYFQFRDGVGLSRHAAIARDLGYDGKSCIHPAQVDIIHETFAPRPDEVAWARGVVDAWRTQHGDRRGVVVLDGEMLEALHVEIARRILDRGAR